MEHSEAISTKATECYLLGEMTAAEADSFEEHYFDCGQCAQDVRLGMALMEGGRQLVREVTAPPVAEAPVVQIAEHRKRQWQWPAATAAATVALFASLMMRAPVSQVAEMPGAALAAPHGAFARKSVDIDPSRSEATANVVPAGGIAYIPIDSTFSRYRLRLIGPDGKEIDKIELSSEETKDYVPVPMAKTAAPGVYTVEISGANDGSSFQPIEPQQFTVQR